MRNQFPNTRLFKTLEMILHLQKKKYFEIWFLWRKFTEMTDGKKLEYLSPCYPYSSLELIQAELEAYSLLLRNVWL